MHEDRLELEKRQCDAGGGRGEGILCSGPSATITFVTLDGSLGTQLPVMSRQDWRYLKQAKPHTVKVCEDPDKLEVKISFSCRPNKTVGWIWCLGWQFVCLPWMNHISFVF